MRAPISTRAAVPRSPLAEVSVEELHVEGKGRLAVISTGRHGLYREFFLFLLAVADRIHVEKQPVIDAIGDCLRSWKELLRGISRMTRDEELGLYGELWTLERLCTSLGPKALQAWTGPLREVHDFRRANNEFEVKTTLRNERVHCISSLAQLTPSPGRELYLLSLQVEAAGMEFGSSLVNMVERVRKLLSRDRRLATKFEELLFDGTAYREEHRDCYEDRFSLRSPAMLVKVSEKFPRITRELLDDSLGRGTSPRIRSVAYEIHVDGLGVEDGQRGFNRLLPPAREDRRGK